MLLYSKGNNQQIEQATSKMEKNFDKKLIFKIYKKFLQQQNTNNLILKWAKKMKSCFSKGNIQIDGP